MLLLSLPHAAACRHDSTCLRQQSTTLATAAAAATAATTTAAAAAADIQACQQAFTSGHPSSSRIASADMRSGLAALAVGAKLPRQGEGLRLAEDALGHCACDQLAWFVLALLSCFPI
jgi:hypothetical protein